jgi:hypothetical protein
MFPTRIIQGPQGGALCRYVIQNDLQGRTWCCHCVSPQQDVVDSEAKDFPAATPCKGHRSRQE